MKEIKGNPHNLKDPIIGKFCTKNNIFAKDKILFCTKKPLFSAGIKAFVVPNECMFKTNLPVIEIQSKEIPFDNGDVLNISKEGKINVLWEVKSDNNAFYVTDICNSKCIMCPQVEGSCVRYDECLETLKLVDLSKHVEIGITGGEPTLNMNKLVELLKSIALKAPDKKVHILTNGRNFSKIENVEKIAKIKNIKVSFGIPLYSDIAEEHDYIVGVKGAFIETINGLYNLAKYRQEIEIRTVILKQNYKQLKTLAEYIYRNLPFVSHVALMGMEYHGNAETNYDLVSIDPIEYKTELYEAVREYVRFNMIVDVYNLPFCLVHDKVQQFCRDSISTWKKTFLPQCANCAVKDICSGVFETSFTHSQNIQPISKNITDVQCN